MFISTSFFERLMYGVILANAWTFLLDFYAILTCDNKNSVYDQI